MDPPEASTASFNATPFTGERSSDSAVNAAIPFCVSI
jgi:hypothetical protein